MSKLNQKQVIMEYLQTGKSLTTAEAFTMWGTMKLPTRVHELRQEGVDIKTENVYGDNGIRYGKYTLVVKEEEQISEYDLLDTVFAKITEWSEEESEVNSTEDTDVRMYNSINHFAEQLHYMLDNNGEKL